MEVCRVQQTRRDKGLPDFPCKAVGAIEFSTFARTVDPRIHTVCLHCPPVAPLGKYCGWEFTVPCPEPCEGADHDQDFKADDKVAALKVPAFTLAHQFPMLEEASVITRREEGKFTLYSLNVEVLRKHRVFE
jgi:DNA-binding transcriptional ArsR family regulator